MGRPPFRSTPLSTTDLADWIRDTAETATASDDGEALLTQCCEALSRQGLPLWRVNISMPALDPATSVFNMAWTAETGIEVARTAHGEEGLAPFLRSPINALLSEDRSEGRWSGDALDDERFPLLRELHDAGATDYILHLVSFNPGTALHGVALSFTTRQPGGFDQNAIEAVKAIIPVFGLACCKLALSYTLRRILGIYLGAAAGTEVLGGRITRGERRTVWAAILLADLRGFTALTDRSDPGDVVGWLDQHFEALGAPVAAHGGEILKFLGDGFIAIFPVKAEGSRPCADCEQALRAALEAYEANLAVNARREDAGLPQLPVDLVLHFGEVVYGNVGSQERLDFTIIGRAVNEASRMEKYCGEFDCPVLVSDTFAARCATALRPVALVPLRGLQQPRQLWTLPALSSQDQIGAAATPWHTTEATGLSSG